MTNELTLQDRVLMLRQLSGRLQASHDPAERWLGSAVSDWLQSGGDLEAALGLRPQSGSNNTAFNMIRRAEVSRRLSILVRESGGIENAAAVLQIRRAPPVGFEDLASELIALRAPKSASGIYRAIKRARAS